MDKQKLASTLWSTVEDLRGNVEAYTYKDYILGLLFGSLSTMGAACIKTSLSFI